MSKTRVKEHFSGYFFTKEKEIVVAVRKMREKNTISINGDTSQPLRMKIFDGISMNMMDKTDWFAEKMIEMVVWN
jgi:hypothetical protein